MDAANPKPRGGLTRGVPVVLDTTPSGAWFVLQRAGLDPKERDRQAILAMAGEYRATFDFIEVEHYGPPPPNKAALTPYQSWGTEKVYVDRDDGDSISLVHILQMSIVDAKGAVSPPMVMKHWRQDWRYEPSVIDEYQGRDRWQRRPVADAERRGAWSQTVAQVDESPRYASMGRWQHNASFSTWISGDTARPLPRREWSVRSDYELLLGTNRHTVGPLGWTQEENNLKAVLTPERQPEASRPFVAREYGIARYERIKDMSFSDADRYYERTRLFWTRVRGAWDAAFDKRTPVTLRGPVDKLGLFMPLFERADKINGGAAETDTADAAAIGAALDAMGVER